MRVGKLMIFFEVYELLNFLGSETMGVAGRKIEVEILSFLVILT